MKGNLELEYKILKYLSEKDSGEPIEVSNLSVDKKLLKTKLKILLKEQFISCRVFNDENITAKIKLKGNEYLNKMESEDKIITNNFNNSTIGQFNQSDELSVLKSEIKQTIHPKAKEKQQNAIILFVVKFWWQILIPLLLGIVLIAIEKKWFPT
jgi:hypothetical protein